MHHKNIKLSIRKQLKNQYPHWNRLNRKTKKEIVRKVLAEVTNEYDFNGDVFCHGACSIPMHHLGVEQQSHEYKCSADSDECTLFHSCPQCRFIPVDGGLFQRIPYHADGIREAHDIRKNCERPFNLLKNQTGLETVRVRSQPATMARCTLGSIAVLLIKMAGMRKKQSTDTPHQVWMFKEKRAA